MRSFARTTLTVLSLCLIYAPAAHAIPAALDECGSVTWEGECEGAELIWCEEGQLLVADCANLGGTCGWSEEIGGNDCVNIDSECGAETYEGRCDGTTVVWCEEDVVYEADCANLEDVPGAICGYSCEANAYDCSLPQDQVTSPEMCGEPGGGGIEVDFGDSDATSDTAEVESAVSGTSGGCAGGGSGSGAVWLLLGLVGLMSVRARRLISPGNTP
jgi:hypothetical protein